MNQTLEIRGYENLISIVSLRDFLISKIENKLFWDHEEGIAT